MPIQITMPALSPTMKEGKLVKWIKKTGDHIESGDIIAEIETDKATMELEAADEGILGKIFVEEGAEGVAVNSTIALLLEEGEDGDNIEIPAPVIAAPPPSQSSAPSPPPSSSRILISPLARRLAEQSGVEISTLKGTGPSGRIVKRDLNAVIVTETPANKPEHMGHEQQVPHSTTRKVIAQRLSQSKRDIPHYYLTVDVQIDCLLETRATLNGKSPEGEGAFKISVNDFVVRAVALALQKHPDVNVSWGEDAMEVYGDVDVSVAVASPGGLVTPVVRKADTKGLSVLSKEIKELAGRAREGKLMPEEYQGGGFTISNLGMFGVKEFSAIINPPQSCILAVGAGEQRPVAQDGVLGIATVMTCTLSVDHRSVDGALGAQFLSTFKGLLEDPLSMLL